MIRSQGLPGAAAVASRYSCSKASVSSVAVFAPEYSSNSPALNTARRPLPGGQPQRHIGQTVHLLQVAEWDSGER